MININPNFTALVTGHRKPSPTYIGSTYQKQQHALVIWRTKPYTIHSTTAHAIRNKETHSSWKSSKLEAGQPAMRN